MEKSSIRPDRPIALVGLMGVGKSTIGRRLAKRLDLPFVDSDSAIEEAAGCTIAQLFERFGEASFREGERRVVARLVGNGPCVVATGGGAFVDEQTRELLNRRALTVWLDAPVELLVERTSHRATRPLLQTGDPLETLRRLAEERLPAYSQAHIRVVSGKGAHNEVVEAIIAALAERGGA